MTQILSRRTRVLHISGAVILGYITLLLIFHPRINFFPTPDDSVVILQGSKTQQYPLSGKPLDEKQWQPIHLPHISYSVDTAASTAWYRFQFNRPLITEDSVAIYIPTVRQNIAIYLNDKWIAQGGEFEPYLARLWSHPQLYNLPVSLLNESNTLLIKLAIPRFQDGYLSNIYIGDSKALEKHWQWRNFVKVTLLNVTSILLIVIGLINIYLWYLRPKDSFYLWYALAAFFWGARGFLLLTPIIPISDELRTILRLLTLGYGIVFVTLFNQRYFGFKNRLFDIAMWLYCIPAALPLFFMEADQLIFYGHHIWIKGGLVLGSIIAIHLLVIFFREHKLDAIYLLYSGLPLLIIGYRDLLVLTNRWTPENGILLNHAVLPAIIVALWFILRRLVSSLRYVEDINQSLEDRISKKEQEISKSYEEQSELRRQQLLSDERERIMRDMHDGIGGHLIGVKSLLDSKSPKISRIHRYVDRALVDLRLVINSLDPSSQNISSLLGSLRRRWQGLADSRDCELVWGVSRTQQEQSLGPEKTLQIMRILEEAFTNCLKHGLPGAITIETGYEKKDNLSWIQMSNLFSPAQDLGQGRGIGNIIQRSKYIGAKIELLERGNVYTIRIVIPF